MPRKYVRDLRRGDTVSEIYLVESANFKQTRNGKFFIQLVLRDATAPLKGLRWEATRDEFRAIERNPFLQATGRIEEYQGSLQIVIDEALPLSADAAQIDPTDFLPRSPYSIDAMAQELDSIIGTIENKDVRRMVQKVLSRPGIADSMRQAPAGKAMHHAYIGGLLEHVLSLARMAQNVAQHYPILDPSLLVGGVVLHDLGKVEELSYRTGFGYTDEGQLVGHIVMVVSWIDEAARALGDVDPGVVLELKHLAASHHGKLEYGSPRVPMTAEALALHFIDNLDAKLAGYEQAYRDSTLSDQQRWGDYNHMMGTRLYFPSRLDRLPHPGSDTREGDANARPGELPF